MNIVDVLNQIWTQILEITALFVTPDWAFVISLLPILILLGVVGPFVTGLMLGTVVYLVRKPRSRWPSRRARASPRSARRRADLPGRRALLPS